MRRKSFCFGLVKSRKTWLTCTATWGFSYDNIKPKQTDYKIQELRQRVKKIFRWLNVLVILATFLAYLAPYVSPEYGWFFSFFGMAFFWLLLLNVFFVLFWLSTKNMYLLFSLACIIMGWGHVKSLIGFNSASTEIHESDLSVTLKCSYGRIAPFGPPLWGTVSMCFPPAPARGCIGDPWSPSKALPAVTSTKAAGILAR